MPEQGHVPEHDRGMPADELADEVWQAMIGLVFDSREPWRRAVVAAAGLPFSRIRVLRRVAERPMALKDIALATAMDAPAASVAVSDLESAGYVVRQVGTADRRSRYVHLTDAGRVMLDAVRAVPDPAPPQLQTATAEQLRLIREVLAQPGGSGAR
ncbi:MarR family winged helix-turn-helix transcriptional regulator [Gordonia sp. DT30]|uniref:MarR family winged helix-turn-helix transcriptional regulator n=1 Tax=unclassified Gordonia (in: high G+C Gram-positive bacteria) TaxID=2657482 RepID=UPI003CF41604